MPHADSIAAPHKSAIADEALDQIFRHARTYNAFLPKPVPAELLHKIYNLTALGPTSANGSHARFVFLTTPEAKQRLHPALSAGNRDKTMAAPVTVIVAWDTEFYEKFHKLFPQADARSWFAGNPSLIEATGLRNSSLQGAYFILAARSLGLDCGPMSGFDNAKVDAEFFSEGKWKSNFLINLGYGDPKGLHPRNPRLAFDEAAKIL